MNENHEKVVIEAGDVWELNTPISSFVMLVMNKDEIPDEGSKVYFRWLDHPEPNMITVCGWVYEASFQVPNAWRKIA